MTDFPQKRFIDLGQTLYVEWLKDMNNFPNTTEEGRRMVFNLCAKAAYEAADEFAEVFCNQENN